MTSSLEATDAAAAAVAVAPRVKLADIEAAIGAVYHTTGEKAVGDSPAVDELKLLSICIIVMRNGYSVVGTSAPASPENFDPDLGRQLAYDHALRQLWPLMGFSLRDRLASKTVE